MKLKFVAALWLLAVLAANAAELPRPHAYAFDQLETLTEQRVFGVGNAVMLLGEACKDDPAATASYTQWLVINGETLKQRTTHLADYYRISNRAGDLQQRVAAAMHLKTRLDLSEGAKSDACASLPETLALPSMDLAKRYKAILLEVSNPDYLKQKRTLVPTETKQPEPVENSHDREEQTRSE